MLTRSKSTFLQVTKVITGLLLVMTGTSLKAQQQPAAASSVTDASAANDPTAPIPQVQIKTGYNIAYEDMPGQGQLTLVRPLIPLPAKGFIASSVSRIDFSLVSEVNGRSGLGDTAFETFFLPNVLAVKRAKITVGMGPYIVAPSATNRYAGQGQWQAGPAAIFLSSGIKELLLAVIEENAITVSGEHARPGQNIVLIQPLIVKSFANEVYLRFDPGWSFNVKEHGTGTIPLNLGLGRVMKLGPQEVSAYIQPEFLARRSPYPDAGSPPRFTLRFAVTLLYPKKKMP